MTSNCCLNSVGNIRQKALCAAIIALLPTLTFALPIDGTVKHGDAVIDIDGQDMDIEQTSQRVVIEFSDFDVESGETVTFHQPNEDSVALNRVTGTNLSEIHGSIDANGQVFLINPNGVLFGASASVQVGGLVVSTLDVEDQAFLSGEVAFQKSANASAIVNQGQLRAHKDVVLQAHRIENHGSIEAGHTAALRSGQAAMVALEGSDIPLFVEDIGELGQVINAGRIHAAQVDLVNTQASGLVVNSGLIRAAGAQLNAGEVQLVAPKGDVIVTGNVDASADELGGEVRVEADRFALISQGEVDVSGGSRAGKITVQTETAIVLEQDSVMRADSSGDAGNITLISTDSTWLLPGAELSASGYNGGFVEVSGYRFVDIQGSVDVAAQGGSAGLWYIDPTNIVINDTNTLEGTMVWNDSLTGYEWTFNTPVANTSQIRMDTIVNTLRNQGDVYIDTNSTAEGAGDVTFARGFDFDGISGRTLYVRADRNIILQSGVSVFDNNPGSDALFLDFTAVGDVVMDNAASLNVGTGDIRISAGGDVAAGILSGRRLVVDAGGQLAIPDAGYTFNTSITLQADDITTQSGDRTALKLVTQDLILGTASSGGDAVFTTDVAKLDIDNQGLNTLNILDVNEIELANLTGATDNVLNGNVGIWSGASSDLIIADPVTLGDGSTLTLTSDRDILLQNSVVAEVDADVSLDASNDVVMAVGSELSSGGGDLSVSAGNTFSMDTIVGGTVNLTAGTSLLDLNGDALNITSETLTVQTGSSFGDASDPIEIFGGDLAFNGAVGGAFVQTQNSLSISQSNLDGNLAIVAASGDISLLEEAPAMTGILSLVTPNGRVRVADNGLTFGDLFSLAAQSIESVSGGEASLTLPQAVLTFTASGTEDSVVSGDLDAVSVNIQGAQNVTIRDSDDIQVDNIVNRGVLTISTQNGGNLNLVDLTVDSTQQLNLQAAGDLLLPTNAPLAVTGGLSLAATNIDDSDHLVQLSADSLQIALAATNPHVFETQATTLSVVNDSTQSIVVNEADALVLAGLQSQGDVSLNTGGDLELVAPAYDVTGTVTVVTPDTASVSVSSDGSVFSGDLSIDSGLLDTAGVLGAQQGLLLLRNTLDAQTLDLSFTVLDLNASGGSIDVSNDGPLSLLGVTTAADFSVLAENGDLTVAGELSVAGDLSLSTSGSGAVVLPETGLAHTGQMSVSAQTLRDSDNQVGLEADGLILTLRSSDPLVVDGSISTLSFQAEGTGQLALINDTALQITQLVSPGDVSVSTLNGGITMLTDVTEVAGILSLTTSGADALQLLDSGLSQSGQLAVDTGLLQDGDSQVSLAATDLALTLQNLATTLDIQADTQSLSLINLQNQAVNVANTGTLAVTQLQSVGDVALSADSADLTMNNAIQVEGNLSLSTISSGNLQVADFGVQVDGDLTVLADDVFDNDRTLLLSANSLDVTLRSMSEDTVWQTSVDQVAAVIAGEGALSISNSQALSVSSLTSDGSIDLNVDGALNMASDTTDVAQGLSLVTSSGNGITMLPAGLSQSAGLILDTDNVSWGDDVLTLQAPQLDLRLRALDNDLSIATLAQSIDLEALGAGALTLANQGALTVGQWASGGDSTIQTINGDLILSNPVAVAGALALSTVDQGRVVLPDSGLGYNGSLSVIADDLVDADSSIALQATDLSLQLRQRSAPLQLQTQVTDLWLDDASSETLVLSNAVDLTVHTLNTASDTTLSVDGNLAWIGPASVLGDLAVASDGVISVGAGGLTAGGLLALTGQSLRYSEGSALLQAPTVNLALSGSEDLVVSLSAEQLELSTQSQGVVSVSNTGDLEITGLNAPAAAQTALDIAGTLVVPDSGLQSNGGWNISAEDLTDSDRQIAIRGDQAIIDLSQSSGDHQFMVSVDRLDLAHAGSGRVQVVSSGPLTLMDLTGDGQALRVSDGDALIQSNGDLLVDGLVRAEDLTADGLATGRIELVAQNGDMNIGVNQSTKIESNRLLDSAAIPQGEAAGLILRLEGSTQESQRLLLGNAVQGSGAVAELVAIGSDLRLDLKGSTLTTASREYVMGEGSRVAAFNQQTDPLSGSVLQNGQQIASPPGFFAHQGRTIEILSDKPLGDLDGIFDDDPLGNGEDVADDLDASPATADRQFALVFGTCDELDPQNSQRCRIEAALKSFLSHWLIGGEMPPRSEIPK